MASDSSIGPLIHTRRSSEPKVANVDPNQFYLVENINTKQRHVITHLFVKYDPTGMSSNVQCKLTPRGTRFEAKILLQDHKDECEKKLNELRTSSTPIKMKKPMDVVEKPSNQPSISNQTNNLQQKHSKKRQLDTNRKLSNTTDQTSMNKKHQPISRRRKLFGSNNVKSLFSDASPSSSSSLSRTPINNVNKTVSNGNQASPIPRSTISNFTQASPVSRQTISNSTQASPLRRSTVSNFDQASPPPRSTTSNISSTLGKYSTDNNDELDSDDYLTDGEQEENLPESRQVQESISNIDDDVQILLNKQENLDLDKLQTKYEKLNRQCESLKKEVLTLKVKYKELEQNTIPKPPAAAREWLIQLGRLCDAKPTPAACKPMATALGIEVSTLLDLIGSSKTQTARNIIHSKLTDHQKATWTHDRVPTAWRTAIHDFIRIIATGEPYKKYNVNEAINGCLREAKRPTHNNGESLSKRKKLFNVVDNGSSHSSSIQNAKL